MRISYQQTPNPNACKFVVEGRAPAAGGPRTYSNPAQAAGEPVAEALLSLEGVREVFMVSDFITVTKSPDADWSELAPAVEAAIEEHL